MSECAKRLGYNRSTISRELRLGLYEHTLSDLRTETRYSCDKAQAAHDENCSVVGPQFKRRLRKKQLSEQQVAA